MTAPADDRPSSPRCGAGVSVGFTPTDHGASRLSGLDVQSANYPHVLLRMYRDAYPSQQGESDETICLTEREGRGDPASGVEDQFARYQRGSPAEEGESALPKPCQPASDHPVANYTRLSPHYETFLSSEGGVESYCQR